MRAGWEGYTDGEGKKLGGQSEIKIIIIITTAQREESRRSWVFFKTLTVFSDDLACVLQIKTDITI